MKKFAILLVAFVGFTFAANAQSTTTNEIKKADVELKSSEVSKVDVDKVSKVNNATETTKKETTSNVRTMQNGKRVDATQNSVRVAKQGETINLSDIKKEEVQQATPVKRAESTK